MKYFWEIVETIEEGLGFNYFDSLHWTWIIGAIVFALVCGLIYRKCDAKTRKILRRFFALLIIGDELFKQYGLIAHGNWTANDLPFHVKRLVNKITGAESKIHTFSTNAELVEYIERGRKQ